MTSRSFIHDDFLLETAQARRLYHEFAEHQAIIDYHCHLPVRQIAEDRRWDNIAQLWLEGDHYKWRAMRLTALMISNKFPPSRAAYRRRPGR